MHISKPQPRIAVSNGWKLRASMREEHTLEIISPNGTVWCTYYGHRDGISRKGTITAFAWSPDGLQVVSASSTGSVHIWNTNGQTVEVLHRADSRFVPIEAISWEKEGGIQY